MPDITINMYNFPAAVAAALIAAGIILQHKNIVYEDSRLHTDQFNLWSEIILMAVFWLILPAAIEKLTAAEKTPQAFNESMAVASGAFVLFFSSLLRCLKNRKKARNEKRREQF